MKKAQVAFVAIALIALLSAFTSVRTADFAGKIADDTYVPAPENLRGELVPGGWDCFPEGEYCLYQLKPGATLEGGVYNDDDVVDPGEGIEPDEHFEYIIPPTP